MAADDRRALGKVGEGLWKRVGREPSGSAFNSIVQLEQEHGIPRNPFINAGAIAVSDVVMAGHAPREAIGELLRFVRYLADDESITIDDKVARWEGDEMPPSPAEVARSGGGDAVLDKSLSTAPKTGDDNWLQQLLRKLGWWQ